LSRDIRALGADGLRLFRTGGSGIVGIPWPALRAFSQTGADRRWLHHTRMETRSPSRWRVQSNRRRGLCGPETYRCPHHILFKKAAAQVSCASSLQIRAWRSPRHPETTSPYAGASARASNQLGQDGQRRAVIYRQPVEGFWSARSRPEEAPGRVGEGPVARGVAALRPGGTAALAGRCFGALEQTAVGSESVHAGQRWRSCSIESSPRLRLFPLPGTVRSR
jgi:hypothetical protein